MIPKPNQTVREIAIEHPATVRVFETLGIDYCCGGQRPLNEACERAGQPIDRVLELLASAEERYPAPVAAWSKASARELIRHIVESHHTYVRTEAPRLTALLEKTVSSHREAHPELCSIRDLFGAMKQELFAHMLKEENVLFPYIESAERALAEGREPQAPIFGSVEIPIARMLADHDDAGELTAKIRALSSSYTVPDDACPTYRALYQGLGEFERDLHQHVHLENNLLFPLALRMERRSMEGACERR